MGKMKAILAQFIKAVKLPYFCRNRENKALQNEITKISRNLNSKKNGY